MSVTPSIDHGQKLPELQGHAVGFVDSQMECDAVVQELNDAGIGDSAIQVLNGDDGSNLLKRMISGSLWGEADEDILKQGVMELRHGHFALIVDSRDRDHAMAIANMAAKHGGHSFTHFGMFADTRLTR